MKSMETMKSMMRIAALTALGIVAAVGIFSADVSDLTRFVLMKFAGFMAAYMLCRMYVRWRKSDKWIKEYERFCKL